VTERLPPRPDEGIRRDRPVSFALDGRRVDAFEGDTIGSALAAAGVSITGRSFKYHRARGLFCMTGGCPNCLMQVDGIPNVRSCTEPVRDGMRVERQNAWPSVDHDIHGWLNTFSFMMPPGFYYKIFHRPRWAWRTVEPFIRSKAGLGRAPKDADHEPREVHNLHADVLVIGAGPAGLAAAAEAGERGCLDDGPRGARRGRERSPGWRRRPRPSAQGHRGDAGVRGVRRSLIAAANGDPHRIGRALVFATGAVEQAAVFPNNDLPGVMLSSAVDLLVGYRVLPDGGPWC
jgi:sarcosine oxidase subunit alpha